MWAGFGKNNDGIARYFYNACVKSTHLIDLLDYAIPESLQDFPQLGPCSYGVCARQLWKETEAMLSIQVRATSMAALN